jgi:hypothetical protein
LEEDNSKAAKEQSGGSYRKSTGFTDATVGEREVPAAIHEEFDFLARVGMDDDVFRQNVDASPPSRDRRGTAS